MRIMIIGGVGFIGTNIARIALEKGYTVIACDNLLRTGVEQNLAYLRQYKQFRFQWCDVRSKEDVFHLPKNIDCIINLAANPAIPQSIKSPVWDFDINVRGHLNVLEFARVHGPIPVIFASSNKVYTDKINTAELIEHSTRYVFSHASYRRGFSEDTDVDGFEGFTNSPYGAAKLAAEKYTREYWKHYGVPIVINRMSCIYGEFQKGVEDQGWVDWFLRAKKFGLPLTIYGNGKQVRDVLFGRDIAELYLEEVEHIEKYSGQTFNVGGGIKKGFNASILEAISLIDTSFPGKPLRIQFKPWRASDQRIYISNISRVSRATNWEPCTRFIDGLRLMWKAYAR